jgi:FixJ family two-component response regulator
LTKVPVISIVDDDALVRESTKSLVRSLGFAAETFASAEEFLQSCFAKDTSCLILDVTLPGLSGVALQSLLIERGQHTPIIFVTAFPEERARTRVLDAGAVGFLTKPFKEESLIKCLTMALSRRN